MIGVLELLVFYHVAISATAWYLGLSGILISGTADFCHFKTCQATLIWQNHLKNLDLPLYERYIF